MISIDYLIEKNGAQFWHTVEGATLSQVSDFAKELFNLHGYKIIKQRTT